jgi:glycosyltransferase involved in cell wall biosynthesis
MTAALTVVVPDGIDDPRRPSGGNRYDRRLVEALRALGVRVTVRAVTGTWPHPDDGARRALDRALRAVPAESPVLVDGLVASGAADLVLDATERVPVVPLVHMPFGPVEPALAEAERTMLTRVPAVVATSDWTRTWLVSAAGVPGEKVIVAAPGADPAEVTEPDPAGTRLICVAAVTRAKGYDVLLAALTDLAATPELAESGWRCSWVGRLDVDARFARAIRRDVRDRELSGRVHFTGPLGDAELAAEYRSADLLLLPSRSETWGLVVTEALARAVPVLASDVGGVPEALGRTADGRRPGALVPVGDAAALAGSLRQWLTDASLRRRWRAAARDRRGALPGRERTANTQADALALATGPGW